MPMLSLPKKVMAGATVPRHQAVVPISVAVPSESSTDSAPVMLSKWQSRTALLRIWWRITQLALQHIPNPFKALQAVKKLEDTRRKYMGNYLVRKVAKSGGRYFFDLNTPGWPSLAFDQYQLMELNRIVPFQEKPNGLKVLLLAITKKCALQCEHCFEWDALNGKE